MKKEIETKEEPQEQAPRFAVVFIDNQTMVQIAAATDDLDKFTKTDLMKMVVAFKEGVKKEEESLKTWKGPNEQSDKRGNSHISKRVRGTSKVHKSKTGHKPKSQQ